LTYGFVYLWRDRKHSRFYVGCHWGTEDDGYVCGSKWMKKAYRKRPSDFQRRILSIVADKEELFDEEYRWLQMIKSEELGTKYYNAKNTKDISAKHIGIKRSFEYRAKMSIAQKGRIFSDETKRKMSDAAKKRPPISEETRQKLSNQGFKQRGRVFSDEHRMKLSIAGKTKIFTEEHKRNISLANKMRWERHRGSHA